MTDYQIEFDFTLLLGELLMREKKILMQDSLTDLLPKELWILRSRALVLWTEARQVSSLN